MIRDELRDGTVYAVSAVLSRGLAFLIVPLYSRLLAPADYAALDLIATAGVHKLEHGQKVRPRPQQQVGR